MKRFLINLPFVLAGVFNLYDSIDIGAQQFLRPAYAAFSFSVLVAVLVFRNGRLTQRTVGIVLGAGALALLPVPFGSTAEDVHIVGDFAVLITIAMCLPLGVAVAERPDQFRSGLIAFFALSFLGALAATRFTAFNRFEPPPPFVLSTLLTFALLACSMRRRLLAFAGVGLVAAIGFSSGFRTFTLLLIVGAAVFFFIRSGPYALTGGLAAIVLVLIGLTFVGISPLAALQENSVGRFGSLASGADDASLSARFLEAEDVFETAWDEWRFPNILLGGGVGSTYVPNRVVLAPNVNSLGRVHNVHIGPVGVFFRHGVIGVGLLGIAGVRIVRSIGILRRSRYLLRSRQELDSRWLAALVLTSVLYAVDFVARNSSVNPGFALSVAGAFALTSLAKKGSLGLAPTVFVHQNPPNPSMAESTGPTT